MQDLAKIREYLENNGFYEYEKSRQQIADGFTKEYADVAKESNKRNILLENHAWQDIHSFGEPRQILILELGGSYFKLFKVEIQSEKKIRVLREQSVQFYENKLYTPEVLFSDMKVQLDAFIREEEREDVKDAVFIFTFPIEQFRRDDNTFDAIATKITKDIRNKDIVGMRIGESLQKFLRERGYENINIGVTNDSVASLLAAKSAEIMQNLSFDAALNIIVGTGANIAVGFDLPKDSDESFYVVNTEFGSFTSPPLSKFDKLFHETLESKDEYLTEKMMSGVWKPRLFKTVLEDMITNDVLPPEALQIFEQCGLDAREIDSALKYHTIESDFFEVYEFIWNEIVKRGATICGIAVANIMVSILKVSDKKQLHFGIVQVGSVLKKAKGFKETMVQAIDSELGRNNCLMNIHYTLLNPKNAAAKGASVFSTLITQYR